MSPVLLLPPDVGPADERWHEVRRNGIGASEIAAVMGLSPWESPFSMFWRKREGWRVEATDEMRTGTRLEPVVADWWDDEHGQRYAMCRAGLYAHGDRPWQLASPDRLLCDGQWHDNPFPEDLEWAHPDGNVAAVLECKWTGRWDGWGDPGTDDIPVYYRTQVLWQCDVMNVQQWHLSVLGPGGFRAYTGHIGPQALDDLALMRAAAADFMRDLVDGTPPDVDAHPATTLALKQLHPTVEDVDVEIPQTIADLYATARLTYQEADQTKKALENELRQLVGSGRRGVASGQPVVTRSVYDQRHVDLDALRAEIPDMVSKHTTYTTVDKLIPARRKKETS